MPEIKDTVDALLYMYSLCYPEMCSETKFGNIPKIYARDTIVLVLMAVVKVRDAPWLKCIKTWILAFLPQII